MVGTAASWASLSQQLPDLQHLLSSLLFLRGLPFDQPIAWSVAHNAKRTLKWSTVQDSPLSLGESFKMYSKLYSNLGESFKTLPWFRGEFWTQAKKCHSSFMLNDSPLKPSPVLGESFKLYPKIGESLRLCPNPWLSPNLGDPLLNAVLSKWPRLLQVCNSLGWCW